MSWRSKKSKKEEQINIEEKKGHLFFGEKDLRLLMLRPIDIIEFTEFAGANAEDIIIWVGKSLTKYFVQKMHPEKDWNNETLTNKKSIILSILDNFEHLGYGIISSMFKENSIFIIVENPISAEQKDNVMAKNICSLYQGMFSGILEELGIEAEGQEIRCYLLGDGMCVFKYSLLIERFSDAEIDKEVETTQINNFMKSL